MYILVCVWASFYVSHDYFIINELEECSLSILPSTKKNNVMNSYELYKMVWYCMVIVIYYLTCVIRGHNKYILIYEY